MTEEETDLNEVTSLDDLRPGYRNPQLSLAVRMRAATAAFPFEHPKLAVTAMVSNQDFAALLEARLKRRQSTVINQRVIEQKVIEPIPHPPAVPDRRFRRV